MIASIPVAEVFEPLLKPARYKGAKGGRASGKSHFFAELWLDENIREKLDCVMIREVQKSLQFSVRKTLAEKIVHYNAGYYFEVQDKKITSRHGGVTIFEGMQDHTSDSIKSLEGFDRAWGEEAQNLSHRSLNMLYPTIRKPGSEMWFSWNPRKPTDAIEQFFNEGDMPPGAQLVKATYLDNPWVSDETLADMERDRRRRPDQYAHIWLGGYEMHSELRVFTNWTVEEFERPAGTIFRLGADWGYSIDPSVLIRCSVDGKRLYVDYEAYMVGCEIVNLPVLFDSVPESRKWLIAADSARPETISHMQKNGYPRVVAAVKGPGSLEEGISFLQSFDIVVHPRCKHTIDELTMYSYKEDPERPGSPLPLLEDKNNHVIDALRYACEGARKARPLRPVVRAQRVMGQQAHGFLAS